MAATSIVKRSIRARLTGVLLLAAASACARGPETPDEGMREAPGASSTSSSEVVLAPPSVAPVETAAPERSASAPPSASVSAVASADDPAIDPALPETPPSDAAREKLMGRPAPDFTLPRVGFPKEKVSLRALHGKVVVLFFFATWAAPAEKGFTALSDLRRKVKNEKRLAVVGVAVDEDANDVVPFAATRSAGAPVVHDAGSAVTQRFGVRAIPATYVLDRAGAVRLIQAGFRPEDMESLRRKIDELAK